MEYRELTKEEISGLEKQYCTADDWSLVQVHPSFSIQSVQQVAFRGTCQLGNFNAKVQHPGGREVQCGIFNAAIINSTIRDHSLIRNVSALENYHVESDVILENVDELAVYGETSFGNGIEIEVLNEGGGRELPIFERLSAQLAYMMVVYRHDAELISSLERFIRNYIKGKTSDTGIIMSGSRVRNSGILRNVFVGTNVTVEGALKLTNGSIIGEEGVTTLVGSGVIAKDFIVQSGSTVDSGAVIDKTFIGQSVKIGKQFSAENSLFFANSEGFHGEAVSVFGGPYTVTHHKSTLLIAGMYSFYNAGSGTNQSNHMYKLGPLHQGIVERGSKTGSFSYLLWPCKVGPFSVVMGKHGGNFDTSDLPFSYLTVENEKTVLTPAMNLITVGTERDSSKWPNRDRRKGQTKLDLIHFDLLNPYVMGKVLNGIDILGDLYEKTPKEREVANYKGVRIKRLMLKSCKKYYEMAMHIFIGDQVIRQLEKGKTFYAISKFRDLLHQNAASGNPSWIDMAGLVVPEDKLADTIQDIKSLKDPDLDALEGLFTALYNRYKEYIWDFTCGVLSDRLEISESAVTLEDLQGIIDRWRENKIRLNNMILSDAKKEFDANSKIGFGLGGDDSIKDADFQAVRGNYEDNAFIKGLLENNTQIENKAQEILGKLEASN